jgi:predicted DNA-binding transcriptional regulator AlpA
MLAQSQQNDTLLTDADVSARIGVTTTTLATWRSTRWYNLPFIKVGRNVRYLERDVQAWLEQRRVEGNK